MTAARSVHRSSLQIISPPQLVTALVAVVLAAGMALAAMSPAAAQDDEATAEASPTAEELQTLREQAIEDGVDQLELPFEEYNDSGIEGTVTFYDLGDETLIAIDIEGGGEEHPAFILEGTCGNTEPEPVERLSLVDEDGESLSLIERSLESLIDEGDYVIDLRLSPQELGVLIACANIEGTTVPATPVDGTPEPETPTAEPTGAGGQDQTPTATATATKAPTTETATENEAAATETEAPTADPTGEGGVAQTPTPTATVEAEAVGGKGDDADGTGGADVAPETVASLPLGDYSDLGVTGTVSLLAIDDDTTRVKITLEGDVATGGHIAHLHPGTCDNLQDEGTIHLESVGADGVSETTVGMSLDELLTSGWSVNVHLSEDQWDTWLICGYLGDATGGMTGVLDVTPVVGGKGTSTGGTTTTTAGKGAAVGGTGDGTAGVSGKGEPAQTSTLTQGVGVGSALLWPESPAQNVAWALGIFALLLVGAGIMVRHGQRTNQQPSRWQRLGL